MVQLTSRDVKAVQGPVCSCRSTANFELSSDITTKIFFLFLLGRGCLKRKTCCLQKVPLYYGSTKIPESDTRYPKSCVKYRPNRCYPEQIRGEIKRPEDRKVHAIVPRRELFRYIKIESALHTTVQQHFTMTHADKDRTAAQWDQRGNPLKPCYPTFSRRRSQRSCPPAPL